MSYDPEKWDGERALPKLYSRTASGAINTWEVWLAKAGGVVVRWGQMDGALQTTVFQCERKNIGRANATSMVEQARREAISKWKKQLKKKYYMSLADAAGPATQSRLRPMLAKKLEDRAGKFKFPVDVQPKLDGVRCLAQRIDGRVQLFSRGGDPYDVGHISTALEHNLVDDYVVLDGEIYSHGMSLQNIISLVKRPQEASLKLTYNVYDIASTEQEEPWHTRRDSLDSWFEWACSEGLLPCVKGVHTRSANSMEELKVAHDYYVEEGYEGAIIRLLDGVYRFGYRSSDLLKMKEFDDMEFELVGWDVGKGKFANVPIFRCRVPFNGKLFDVTPRGTAEVRRELLTQAKSMMGKKYTVRYFGLTDEGVPRFPAGIGVREKGM
jgi:DNA ligase-1